MIDDLKLAASKMRGEARRSFQAAMSIKYCEGSARQTESMFGWNRETVAVGLHERRTGIICLGGHEAFCGNVRWEERYPEAAKLLWGLAQTQSQQDPSFRTTLSYTRLTATEATKRLAQLGVTEDELPSPSAMAEILNRNGYRLRPVIKAKPQKKSPRQTTSLPISAPRTDTPSMAGK
ncbi:MAG: hypothetical protein Q8K23_00440 [Sulfuritalea sp.]|jgi:hypothetical protein|nr:hypothetical protein [Sulfuritalea sp.]